MNEKQPVALWAVPRSISTAFERVFVERDDFEVLHEPFSASYYRSEDRLSSRFADEETKPENNYENVLQDVLRPREQRVFLKDMAYHAKPLIGPDLTSRFVNTFIIRDPKYVLTSMYKMWPDFTFEEAGYEELYRLFRICEEAGQEPVVVDAMTFSENPVEVLSVYCERVGIPFREDDLTWQPREVRRWENWEGWHDVAQRSSGIKRAERRDPVLPRELEEMYERCLPAYYDLAAHAIHGTRGSKRATTMREEGR
ncbi:MAG TPA: hypothetical protein VFJ72_06170 [Rubrobacteraceae bacterium]|nr:hypothetical protein [Rubrobacteraceae bacterium]